MTDLYLRTSIRSEAEKDTLKTGCKAALAASSLIVGSEYVLPLLEFDTLGLWAWIVGGSTAGLGLLPYQRLKSQKKNPDILHSTEETISLFHGKTCLFTLSWDQIESFQYLDTGKEYGLAFNLKAPLEGIWDKCRKEHGVDLFLPYFSHASFLLLEKWRDQHVTVSSV